MAKPKPKYIFDRDTTDEWMDKPEIVYEDGSTVSWEDIEKTLAKAERGEITLRPLPPPVEH